MRRCVVVQGKVAVVAVAMFVAAVGVSVAQAQLGVVDLHFTASDRAASGNLIPPDTMGAVGPTQIVELINGRYKVFDREGSQLANTSLNQFWTNAGVTPLTGNGVGAFDPRVVYDPYVQRWYASAVDGAASASSGYLLSVSDTANPTDGWTAFHFDADATNTRWADFDMLGFDRDGVYISANMFAVSSGAVQRQVYAIPKSDLLSATPTIANIKSFTGLSFTSTAQAVVVMDNTGLSDYPMTFWRADAGIARHDQLSGSFETGLSLSSGVNTLLTTMNAPTNARQPNGTSNLEVDDDRFSSNLVRIGNSIWGVQTRKQGSNDVVRWFEIDATTYVKKQEGVITLAGQDIYYPSIAVNASGNVVIGFSGSGPGAGQYPSAYAAVGVAGSVGAMTFDAPMLIQAGVASYYQDNGSASGRNRWGDYSATVTDPTSDYIFWTFQEYAKDASNWAVEIGKIVILRPGDFNIDGYIDATDVNSLHSALHASSSDLLYDVNDDGMVTSADMRALVVDLFGYLPGDANLSGTVNLDDLAIFQNNYLLSGRDFLEGDFNGNGIVNLDDLAMFQNHYLQSGGPGLGFSPNFAVIPVPEPGSALLVLGTMGGMVLTRRRRR